MTRCLKNVVLALATLVVTVPAQARAAVDPLPDLITPSAHAAVQRALALLVRSQLSDGSFPATTAPGSDSRPDVRSTCVMTALAGLALMAGGNTPLEGRYAPNVDRAVRFLMGSITEEGLITAPNSGRPMYGHGFAMLFLAQAYGMLADPDEQADLRKVLENAVQLTVRAQANSGSWSYSPNYKFEPGEGSVTVTQIQGLRACRNAGIKVPKSTIDGACEFIKKCQEPDGGIAYQIGRPGARPPITAAAVATMYNAGEYEHPVALGALEYTVRRLRRSGPKGAQGVYGGHQAYGLFYAAQGIWFGGEELWRELFPPIRTFFVSRQDDTGSIEVGGQGNIFSTAIAAIVLQIPNQYLPILQR